MEVTTGAVRYAKLQSDHHHKPSLTLLFPIQQCYSTEGNSKGPGMLRQNNRKAFCICRSDRAVVRTIMLVFFSLSLTSELTSDSVRCCSSCFNRVTRMINDVQPGEPVDTSDGWLHRF